MPVTARAALFTFLLNLLLWLAGGLFVNELYFQTSGTGFIYLVLGGYHLENASLRNMLSSCSSVFLELPLNSSIFILLFL